MKVIGIHDGHNASACLLQDGVVTHAVQEERFTRNKNQAGFPAYALEWILADAKVELSEVAQIAYGSYSNTFPFDRETLVRSYRRQAVETRRSTARFYRKQARLKALKAVRVYDKWKQVDPRRTAALRSFVGATSGRTKVSVYEHHRSHAASAYYGSPFAREGGVVLTLDGEGDGISATVSVAREGKLKRVAATDGGHSLGNIYARCTANLGFVPLEHEYKLMGLAPYADEERSRNIASQFARYLRVDGMKFRRQIPEPTPFIGRRLHRDLRFVRFDELAGGLQLFTEQMIVDWVRQALRELQSERLFVGGGVFMNVKANMLVAQLPEVQRLFVLPSCGDETLAIGAAYLAYRDVTGGESWPEPLSTLYLGPAMEEAEITGHLERLESDVEVHEVADASDRVGALLSEGEIVARAGGRMEFGARALGNRSIFMDPTRLEGVSELNAAIKMRDFWMPFAPVVLDEYVSRYVRNEKEFESPFMMLAFETTADGFDAMRAACHPADRTARAQMLKSEDNAAVARMLRSFARRTGRGGVLNTSYNVHGEPIVRDAQEAVDVFARSGLRWLWLGENILLRKRAKDVGPSGSK